MSDPAGITLFFLNASRAIRTAWLLAELGLDYTLVSANRAPNGLAPAQFKQQIPNRLGKSPTITDTGSVNITESGAIAEYLCETYDTEHRLLPRDPAARGQVREWLHAAEGTFMIHGVAVLYARWNMPEGQAEVLREMERGMSKNVRNDLDWLEEVLVEQQAKARDWIVGDTLSLADIQMQFSIDFIFERKLGVDPSMDGYPAIQAWLARTKGTDSYQRAVAKTGYTLDGDFRK